MTKEEAIKYLQQLYPNGGHCWLDEQRIEAIGMAVKALSKSEDPVSKDYRERYKNIAQSDAFKSVYENKSLGEVVSVEEKEPVSEELEEAAKEYVTKEGYLAGLHYNSMVRSFKAGAQWQKEKESIVSKI